MIHLAFVCSSRRWSHRYEDIRELAERVRRLARDVSPKLISDRRHPVEWLRRAWLSTAPTLVVDVRPRARPIAVPRGRYLKHWRHHDKIEETRILEAAGLPVPRWAEIRPDTRLDPEEWGPYVVVKPSCGRRGAFVWIQRTGRVRYRPPEEYPAGHLGREGPMFAQQFIYTGRWPVAFRVMTFLGRPLLAVRYEGRREGIPPLEGIYDFRAQGGGGSIVANAKGCKFFSANDADILGLATRVHGAFPGVPTLGVDLIRDADSGRLFVLETNPRGSGWILSSGKGKKVQEQFGLDFYGQFGALDVAAEAAVEAARRWAC